MSEQRENGFGGFTLLFCFAGGALAGAAAAYLAQQQNRARVRDLASSARQRAGRLPKALRDASSAAQETFIESYGVASKRDQGDRHAGRGAHPAT